MIIHLPFEVLYIVHRLIEAGFEAYIVGGAVRDTISHSLKKLQKPTGDLKTPPIADYDFATNAKPAEILALFADSYYENDFGMVAIAHDKLLANIALVKPLPEKNLQNMLVDRSDKKSKLIDVYQASKIHASLKDDPKHINSSDNFNKTKIHDFEITTYRSENIYSDFRHPDQISWGKTIAEDLQRRDFTINAMALKINDDFLTTFKTEFTQKDSPLQSNYLLKSNQYQLIDQYAGMQDLAKGVIKTVGLAKQRFFEDALRLLRAIRFAVQLDFQLDQDVLTAIKEQSALIQKISWERIRDEFLKMLASQNPKKAIELLDGTGLLAHILPELLNTKGTQQAGHHTTDVWTHSLDAVQNCPSKDPIVRLATLLHDIGKPQTQNFTPDNNITFYNHEIIGSRLASRIGKRLRLSNSQLERLFIMVRHHMFYYQPTHTDSAIRRFMRQVGLVNVDDMLDLREGDRLGSGAKKTSWRLEEMKQRMLEQLHQPMAVTDLAINGHDLMEKLNLNPGPVLGIILNQLLEIVLEEPTKNNQDDLLLEAQKILQKQLTGNK